VLHSFWIPQLGGKRDLIANHTNYLWFTPDSMEESSAWNGFCAEYCGASHANMRFRAFTVRPEEFEAWAAHQRRPAVYGAAPAPGAATPPTGAAAPAAPTGTAPIGTVPGGTAQTAAPGTAGTTPPAVAAQAAQAAAANGAGYVFPSERLAAHLRPATRVPASLTFPAGLTGDPARGQQLYSRSACIGCHVIAGNPMSVGVVGPNLTHFGSRHTLAAGLYPNDAEHLAKWIKNSRLMKPGSLMPALGRGQLDPVTRQTVSTGGLTDQEIADIVAYLQALK
jgi:cytochrome c oxidase subunit II